ncbi:type II toxin-antitoxin system HipA family toxin [Thermomonas sp.]|uniref:type II toxin-antitoxin system HipA family toxin n=1 Tax=Thermomonas sp. TaxID=1971895 RepID=UPI00261EBD5D|nr:type II toxin-antitoxin system HipA family toxin [Thermomonas sp.]
MKIKRLHVTTPLGLAGDLHRESQYVFNYATTDRRGEVSLTMPIRAQSYAGNPLPPVFAMNLPEGYLYDMIVRRMAKHERIDDMRLLAITGRQQIGRLQFAVPGEQRQEQVPRIGLTQLRTERASRELFEFLVDAYFDSGISGVQPKVMLPDADRLAGLPADRATLVHSDLIVKSGGGEYEQLARNEFLCMDAARRAGLTVPEFWLSDDGSLFIMRRFDLTPARRGFEDMSVLMGKTRDPQGNYKYTESYEAITRFIVALTGTDASANLAAFFEYLAFCAMVRNGDAHLKNFGLTYDDPVTGSRLLAPLYDVVTTTAYPYLNWRTGEQRVDRTLALKLFSGAKHRNFPSRGDLLEFGRTICRVRRPEQVLERIGTAMSETWQAHGARLEGDFRERMATEWEAGRQAIAATQVFVGR